MQSELKYTSILKSIHMSEGYSYKLFCAQFPKMVKKIFNISHCNINAINWNLNDNDIITHLMRFAKDTNIPAEDRGLNRANYISKLLNDNKVNLPITDKDCALDFGCGDGYSGHSLFNNLGFNKDNRYGIDIYDQKTNPLNYIKINNVSDIPLVRKYKVIFCNMSLHHVEKLEVYLNVLRSLLDEGGVFIIREHDAINPYHKAMVDIEHVMYIIKNKERLLLPITNVIPVKKWCTVFKVTHLIAEFNPNGDNYSRPYLMIATK